MPVVHDATTLSSFQGVTANTVTLTWAHTTGVAANNYGLVTIVEENGGSSGFVPTFTTPPSVSIGSKSLTSLGWVLMGNTAAAGFLWVFGASGVPTGSQTVTATVTDTGTNWGFGYGLSQTYTGVGSVSALQTSFGISTTPSLTVPSATGDLAWGAIGNYQSGSYSSFTLTARQTQISNAPFFIVGDGAGASSVTVSATQTVAYHWGAVGLDFLPAGTSLVIPNVKVTQAINRSSRY